MVTAIVTSDIMSALFMGILLVGARNIRTDRKRSTEMFMNLLVVTIIGGWSDALSFLAEGVVRNRILLYILNLASYLCAVGSLVTVQRVAEAPDYSVRHDCNRGRK